MTASDRRSGSSRLLEPRRLRDRLVEEEARRPRLIGRLSLGMTERHGRADDLDER